MFPPALIVVLLPLMWVAVLGVVSAAGWQALGERYRRRDEQPTLVRRFRSLSVVAGRLPCNYSGCVTVGASPAGLFLRVLPVFRPFHPPLYIPWSAIQTTARTAWYGKWLDLTFMDVPGVTVRLSAATAQKLADAVGGFPSGSA